MENLKEYQLQKSKIDTLTKRFFNLFTNTGGTNPQVEEIFKLFIPEGIIIKNVSPSTEIYNLQQFVEPRKKILTDGTLTEFQEKEISEQTDIFGNIAQRFSLYQKKGIFEGKTFETRGMKSIQFVKVNEEWKISSLAWDDE